MGHCEDCKHWYESTDKSRPEWGRCDLATSKDNEPEYATSKAVAFDTEMYFAVLTTAPDFGCVQFEEDTEEASNG